MNWRLRNEDGTPLPTSCFFDLTHGVMTMDQSEESEEDDDVNDYSGDLAADGKLIHHENEQFFNLPWIMSDLEHIGIV